MKSTLLLSLVLAGGGLAQSSVDLFVVNEAPVSAYAVASDATATTYLVACAAGTDPSACPFLQPYTVTEGPNTAHVEFTIPLPDGVIQSLTVDCSIDGTTSGSCYATALGNDSVPTALVTTTVSFTYTGAQASSLFSEVPIVTNAAALLTYYPPGVVVTTALNTSTATTSCSSNSTSYTASASSVYGWNSTSTGAPATAAITSGPVLTSVPPSPTQSKLSAGSRLDGKSLMFVGLLGAVVAGICNL